MKRTKAVHLRITDGQLLCASCQLHQIWPHSQAQPRELVPVCIFGRPVQSLEVRLFRHLCIQQQQSCTE